MINESYAPQGRAASPVAPSVKTALFAFAHILIAIVSIVCLRSTQALAAAPNGAVAFVGTDSQIYYCAQKCKEPQCLTCPSQGTHVRRDSAIVNASLVQDDQEVKTAQYGWPTFSADGTRLAYSSVIRTPKGMSFAVTVYDLANREATEIFKSSTERIVYVFWLADGKHISFLLNEPNGLSLLLSEVRENAPARIVTNGLPLYFDWASTPDMLALHTIALNSDHTEQVSLMSLTPTTQRVEKVLSNGRTPFKTPSWSADGKHLAYIANYHAESNLVVADSDGKNPRSVVSLPVGENCLVWAPDSRHIAYSTAMMPENPTFHGIKIVDISDASSRWLSKDDVTAFFFSPDSRHLAYISVPEEKPFYTWQLIDLKTGKTRGLGNFLTTQDESIAYRFFDQLALSHTIWSPDSSAFVFAGVRLMAEPNAALGMAPPPSVYVVPIDGSKPREIANGTIAFFSPAPVK